MIVNVINKKLNNEELKFLKKISAKTRLVNIDTTYSNDKINVHCSDFEKEEREILINANNAAAIIFWGTPSAETFNQKVLRSLLGREFVYFTCIDESDYHQHLELKQSLPPLLGRRIHRFLGNMKKNNKFTTIDEIVVNSISSENSVKKGIKEIYSNRHMIWKMAYATFHQETLSTTLGAYWHLIRDVIFFITYVTFMLFMRGSGDIDGIPAVLFLVTGLVAWYYMSDVIGGGAACIRHSKGIISKVKFPITIIPIYSSIGIFYRRGLTYVILFLVFITYFFTNTPNVDFDVLKFVYYTLSMLIFMTGFNLLFSSFVAISRDFHELYKSFVRIQMYFNPIFWDISSITNRLSNSSFFGVEIVAFAFNVLMLNPTVYILNGYREVFGANSGNGIYSGAVFWGLVIIMYLLGFKTQERLRGFYADVI